jgi:hypothetical protein
MKETISLPVSSNTGGSVDQSQTQITADSLDESLTRFKLGGLERWDFFRNKVVLRANSKECVAEIILYVCVF